MLEDLEYQKRQSMRLSSPTNSELLVNMQLVKDIDAA